MARYKLYSRPDCHLCDEAHHLFRALAPSRPLEVVDIEGELDLVIRYGMRVPVLHDTEHDKEMGWPFGPEELGEFLGDSQG